MNFEIKQISPNLSKLNMQEVYFWYGCFFTIVPIVNFTSSNMINSFMKIYKNAL
jgi:hypothetical protein